MASNTGLNFNLFEDRRLSFANIQLGVCKDFLPNNGFHCDSPTTAKCHFCGNVVNLFEYERIDEKNLHHDYCKHLHGSGKSQNEPLDETWSTHEADTRGSESEECMTDTPGINSKVTSIATIKVTSGVKLIVPDKPVTLCSLYGRNNALDITVESASKLKIRIDCKVSPDDETGSRFTDEPPVKLGDKGQSFQDQLQEIPEHTKRCVAFARGDNRRVYPDQLVDRAGARLMKDIDRMVDISRAVQDLETREVYLCGNIHSWQPDCEEERTTQGQNAVPVVHLIPVENQRGVPPREPYGTSLLAL